MIPYGHIWVRIFSTISIRDMTMSLDHAYDYELVDGQLIQFIKQVVDSSHRSYWLTFDKKY